MSSFSIKPEHAKGITEEEGNWIKELESIELRISSAQNGIELGTATARFKSKLGALAADVNQEYRGMKEMKNGLESVYSSYVQTENTLLGNSSQTEKTPITKLMDGMTLFPQDALSALLVNSTDTSFWDLFGFKVKNKIKFAKASVNMISALHNSNLPNDNFLKKTADKLKAFNDKGKRQFVEGYFDEDGIYHNTKKLDDDSEEKKKYDDISSLDEVATIASVGTNVSRALWEAHLGDSDEEFKKSGAHGSVEAALGKTEGSASFHVGIYSYSADGEKHLTPGFGADMGVGFTAFTVSMKGQVGNEYFNLHGNTSIDVGKVDAKAAVNVGVAGPDGKFNPQAKVRLSAEALALEAKVKGGANIAGTSVEATGSITFGVGGHADLAIQNGHISVDIGASFGVGTSVKLDIDMSGTINAVSDFAGAAADVAKDAWTSFTGWFK